MAFFKFSFWDRNRISWNVKGWWFEIHSKNWKSHFLFWTRFYKTFLASIHATLIIWPIRVPQTGHVTALIGWNFSVASIDAKKVLQERELATLNYSTMQLVTLKQVAIDAPTNNLKLRKPYYVYLAGNILPKWPLSHASHLTTMPFLLSI